MMPEDIGWHVLRLSATTSSICLALVGWFAHYLRQEIHRLAERQAGINRDRKEARHLLGLASGIPIFVGLGSFFLIIAGILSIWVATDAAGLTEWNTSVMVLFFVAVGAPLISGVLLLLFLLPDICRSLYAVGCKILQILHIKSQPVIILTVPKVSASARFNVVPHNARIASWRASRQLLEERSVDWGLGKGFLQVEQNVEALAKSAQMAYLQTAADGDDQIQLQQDSQLDALELATQRIIDGLLRASSAHTARLPVSLSNLAGTACYLAYSDYKE